MSDEPAAVPPPSHGDAAIEWPDIVPPEKWWAYHEAFLIEEKALMRANDALVAKRRNLPMVEVSTHYRFIEGDREIDLLGLFNGHRQLIVYRFFFAPDVENWPDGGCSGCSMFADQVTHHAHLEARDTRLVFASAAPQKSIEKFKRRMAWSIPWVTLPDERFSHDFDVETKFGINVFIQNEGRVFRTYFTNGRAIEAIGPVWSFLDLTPLGRQETWQTSPPGRPVGHAYDWWRLHDHYDG